MLLNSRGDTMADGPSAEQTPATPTPAAPAAEVTPAATTVPAGHVAISETERNRLYADNRRLSKDVEDRATADSQRATQERQDAAQARGDFDVALQLEQDKTAAANLRADQLSVKDELRDAISAKGFDGDKAKALKDLVDISTIALVNGNPAVGAVEAAVDAVTSQYPAMFKLEQAAAGPETPASVAPAPRTAAAPATPVSDGAKVGDYLTPEEYMATPRHIRLTPEFRERVKRSEPNWPIKVSANSFAQGV